MNQNGDISVHELEEKFKVVYDRTNDILREFDNLLDAYRTCQRAISWLFLTNLISIIVIFFLLTKGNP